MKWQEYNGIADSLRTLHDTPFRAHSYGKPIQGVIAVIAGTIYLCQNILDGEYCPDYIHDYDYSWAVYGNPELRDGGIDDLMYLVAGRDNQKLYKRVLK